MPTKDKLERTYVDGPESHIMATAVNDVVHKKGRWPGAQLTATAARNIETKILDGSLRKSWQRQLILSYTKK